MIDMSAKTQQVSNKHILYVVVKLAVRPICQLREHTPSLFCVQVIRSLTRIIDHTITYIYCITCTIHL